MVGEILAVGMTIAVVAIASALSQGWVGSRAMDAMARQPEAAGTIQTSLLLSLAFIEALTLFTFVISVLLWTRI
jgi:F-type H+-transporting ATPase subunit c